MSAVRGRPEIANVYANDGVDDARSGIGVP